MPKYDLILFDADGTLFDYDRAEAVALEQAFAQHQLPYNADLRNAYRAINSALWRELEAGRIDKPGLQVGRFQRLFATANLHADAHAVSNDYLAFLGQCGHLLDGAVDVCRELARSCTLVIATNGIARTQRGRLGCCAIAPFIRHIVVSEDAGHQKPHPGFFTYAFTLCNWHDKRRAIIIGDSLATDIKGGADFGIATCWYNPSRAAPSADIRADHEITDLNQVMDLVL